MNIKELQALLSTAAAEEHKGNYAETEGLAQQVLRELDAETPPPEHSAEASAQLVLRAEATRLLGSVAWRRGINSSALEYGQAALSLAESSGDTAMRAKVMNNIGLVYNSLSDYAKALEYYARALSQHEEVGDKANVARVTGNIGIVYAALSDYAKALEYYARALSQREEVGDKAGVADVTGNIGIVYFLLSDYPKALEYYARALSQHEEVGNKVGVAAVTGNIGIVYDSLSDYPKALEYYSRALSQHEEGGDKTGVALVTGNIGTVYASLSDYPKALEYLSRGLKWQDELGQRKEAAITKASLGGLYAIEANPERDEAKAEEYLRESISTSEDLGTKNYEAHKTLAEIYERRERWQDFAFHLKKYHELKDEVQSEEANKTAVQMEQRRQIAEREKEIAVAKAAADAQMSATTKLLYKVLPQSVATRMIEGEEEIADYFPQVSILFADIAGFTPISADMPAIIVVRFLNYVFREFDRIVKKHGCEKIKTIGDGYMAVAGAPEECADHAERLVMAALEMQETITLPESIREYMPAGTKLGVRIGLHTGSVVAGVIGEERFVYDIYSDAVNTASRMESHGEENKIHISNDYYRHLQNRFAMTKNTTHGLTFEKRGEIEIKGKGMMRTYYLEKA